MKRNELAKISTMISNLENPLVSMVYTKNIPIIQGLNNFHPHVVPGSEIVTEMNDIYRILSAW